MNLVKVISSEIEEQTQLVKFSRFADYDTGEKETMSPYGVDSNPIAGMIGLYVKTGEMGQEKLVGYINKRALAQPGELRLFSTDDSGTEQAYLYFKNDGFIHFNGDEDNMVRFSKLEQGFNELRDDYNNFIQNAWNAFCGVYIPGGPTVVGSPLTLISVVMPLSTASIMDAKIVKMMTSMDD